VELAGIVFRARRSLAGAKLDARGLLPGNFQQRQCAAARFTLRTTGPFGSLRNCSSQISLDAGGEIFSFLNQPVAAEGPNNQMFGPHRLLLDGNTKPVRGLRFISTMASLKRLTGRSRPCGPKTRGLIHYDHVSERVYWSSWFLARLTNDFLRRLSDIWPRNSQPERKELYYMPSSAATRIAVEQTG